MKTKESNKDRKKLYPGLAYWGVWMTFVLFILIYSLILILKQDTPLFTRHHLANELVLISSLINVGLGIFNLVINKKDFFGQRNETKSGKK